MRTAAALLVGCLSAALAAPLAAQVKKPGEAEFRRLDELIAEDYQTVPATGGGTVFGMRGPDDLFLCFLADTPDMQAERQKVILGALKDDKAERTVPNIPLVCVKTE